MPELTELEATKETLRKLGYSGTNEAFDAVLSLLETFVSVETVNAIAADLTSERRHHACGRVEALVDFKAYLIDARTEAKRLQAQDVE